MNDAINYVYYLQREGYNSKTALEMSSGFYRIDIRQLLVEINKVTPEETNG